MSSADQTGGDRRQGPAGGPPPEIDDVHVTVDIDGLHALRSTLAAHASALGAPGEQVEALIIVATELATNAIRHGGGTGQVRLWHHGDVLYCQVSDEGPGIADPAIGSSRPDPMDAGGHRGLWICRNLAEELTIRTGPEVPGSTITAAIHRPDHR